MKIKLLFIVLVIFNSQYILSRVTESKKDGIEATDNKITQMPQINIQEAKKYPSQQFPDDDVNINTGPHKTEDLYEKAEKFANTPDERPKGVAVGYDELEANKKYDSYNPLIKNHDEFVERSKSPSDNVVFNVISIISIIAIFTIGFFFLMYKHKEGQTDTAPKSETLKVFNSTKIIEELEKLQSLRSNGAINDEEFDNLKKNILAK